MAKKVILKDNNNIEILPITRGELITDSSGNPAFHSIQFLATDSQPGLMSAEDKAKLDNIENISGEDKKVEQVNTTTNDSYRLLFSSTADDTTRTEGARKSANLLFNPSTGALTAPLFNGKLDWSNINNKPDTFTPEQHTHTTNEIVGLLGYTKAESPEDLVTTDTLNVALGKLEYKADTVYTWYRSITDEDTDDIVNKWGEIVDFIDSVAEGTDITDEFVTRKTGQTITGEKIFSGTSDSLLTIDRNSTSPAWIKFAKNNSLLGYIGIDNNKKPVANINDTTHFILHSGNSYIKNKVITINGASITPLTSHQSLANYVTLNGIQTISGAKTFTNTIVANVIKPQTTNTYTLGTSSLQWNNIYSGLGTFSGNVTAAGFVKIDSSNDKVLLGAGGDKDISDFVLKTDEPTTEISKTLTVTSDWMDTGISGSDIPSNGTYVVQIQCHQGVSGSFWYCYWSGIMSWYSYYTNDTESDEIILHRSGHAYHNTIYLRTIMSSSSDGRHLRLQIAANKNIGAAYTYTFKFKRII